MKTTRRFRVTDRNFDGRRSATVIIEPIGTNGDRWNLTVRPHGRRHTVTVSLADVAERLLWQEARDRARRSSR